MFPVLVVIGMMTGAPVHPAMRLAGD